MPLEHSLVTNDDDFYKFAPLMFEAIRPNGFVDACWPRNLDQDAQRLHASGFIAHKGFDSTVKWCKVTDTETGDIIGVAQWLIIKDQKPPEFDFNGPPGTWKDENEKLYAQDIYRSFVRYRREVISENELPILVLSIMTVHPKHQYRGAGTMMMKWGTDLADEIGALVCQPDIKFVFIVAKTAKSVVEGTLAGRWLYENSGFKVEKHYSVEASGDLSKGIAQRLFFMVRPRAGRE